MTVEKVYDLIAKTSLELGYNTDGETMASLAKIFANDLQTDKRLVKLSFADVETAFRLGVRNTTGKQQFLNITTFTWWCFQHKERINDAISEVEYYHKNPNEVEYYPKNLLK